MSTNPAVLPQDILESAPTQPEAETPLEGFASICSMLAVYLFATAFIFQNFQIPSGSMEKTLLIGDHPLVDRVTFAPSSWWTHFMPNRDIRRGDIVVFFKPNPETPDLILVKRVIGLPGDRIHLQHGIVFLNGIAQNEPYAIKPGGDDNPQDSYIAYRDDFPADLPGIEEAASANKATQWSIDLPHHVENGDLIVPPGKVFAMGDNRPESLDGRFWGFIPRENILGRPLFIYWSFKTGADEMYKTSIAERVASTVHTVIHIFDETRWKRTLHVVR